MIHVKLLTGMQKRRSGFTLIELLIVIAIIGVLATLLMANFVGVRQRARDAQRKSDLRQIQSALEIYRSDNGSYPLSAPGQGNFPTACGTGVSFTAVSSGGTTTTYMGVVPCDPSGTGAGVWNNGSYYYTQLSNGANYTLGACLENGADNDQKDQSTNPSGSGSCTSGKYYVLTSQ
jgi:general secretion pathway protein G